MTENDQVKDCQITENLQVMGFFGRFKKREMILDLTNETLQIINIKKKKVKEYAIKDYEIQYLGKVKKNFCFKLHSSNKDIKIKKITIGNQNEEMIQKWFQQIYTIINEEENLEQSKFGQDSFYLHFQRVSENEEKTNQPRDIQSLEVQEDQLQNQEALEEVESNYDSSDESEGEEQNIIVSDFQFELQEDNNNQQQQSLSNNNKQIQSNGKKIDLPVPTNMELINSLDQQGQNNYILQILEQYYQGAYTQQCITTFFDQSIKESQNNDTQNITQQDILQQQYERAKDGGLNYLNTDLIKKQRGVLGFILKKIGSNILQGVSLGNLPVPILIFDSMSMLERIAQTFRLAPIILEQAGNTTNPLEAIKLTSCFVVATLNLMLRQEKPFNPVVGETFQGRINGVPIYVEQISHHPPIASYYMVGKSFILHGNHEMEMKLLPNYAVTHQLNVPKIYFPKTKITHQFRWPQYNLHGLAMGQRYINFINKVGVVDSGNNMISEIVFNPEKKKGISKLFSSQKSRIDTLNGTIYRTENKNIQEFINDQKNWVKNLNIEKNSLEDLSQIEGFWNEYLKFDDKMYWDIKTSVPCKFENEEIVLPSDCNFREDVLYMRIKNQDKSAKAKDDIEQKQRNDKDQRKAYQKNKKKQ